MSFTDGSRGRARSVQWKRTVWQQKARKVLDSWGGGAEFSVATALEAAYVDGLNRAAAFIEEKGQRELAMALRRLADEKSGPPR